MAASAVVFPPLLELSLCAHTAALVSLLSSPHLQASSAEQQPHQGLILGSICIYTYICMCVQSYLEDEVSYEEEEKHRQSPSMFGGWFIRCGG